jgi:hypothetical protein
MVLMMWAGSGEHGFTWEGWVALKCIVTVCVMGATFPVAYSARTVLMEAGGGAGCRRPQAALISSWLARRCLLG